MSLPKLHSINPKQLDMEYCGYISKGVLQVAWEHGITDLSRFYRFLQTHRSDYEFMENEAGIPNGSLAEVVEEIEKRFDTSR